jgi:hypothetical protein
MGGGGGMGTGRIRGGGGRGEEEEEGGAHLQTPSGTRRGHGDPAIFLFSFCGLAGAIPWLAAVE